ncbi:MAG: hypothetical protein U9R79_06220 [Armatimonadota bacterium]|nr:hypothetical protein [Armatimonadota bacterium]
MRTGLRTSALIAIPFALLFHADRVVVSTTVYSDLSGVRRVHTEGNSTYAPELRRWIGRMTPGFETDRVRRTGDTIEVSRSTQRNNLGAPDDVQAQALDVVQKPLSLVTEYQWRETIALNYVTEEEREVQPLDEFEYRLVMPGRITQASPAASIDGRTAVWKLSTKEPEYEVSAAAVSWRWDIIVLLVYVVGYLAYRTTAFLVHRARLRPRKI